MQDLENYIGNHSEARLSCIQEVGRQLADAQIMPAWIRAEIHAVTERWNTLREEVMSHLRLASARDVRSLLLQSTPFPNYKVRL